MATSLIWPWLNTHTTVRKHGSCKTINPATSRCPNASSDFYQNIFTQESFGRSNILEVQISFFGEYKMLFNTLMTLSSTYSMLAIVILISTVYLKKVHGLDGFNRQVNTLAKSKTIVVFEVYSWFSIVVWVTLALPWVDLFTANYMSGFKSGGVTTYFGWMSSKQAGAYFVLMFMNILGVKAAMKLTEIAAMLRRGRVHLVRPAWGAMVWMPIEK